MDLILRDDFESGFSKWTAVDNAGYYTYSSGTDYSTTFDSAGRMTDGQIVLAEPLRLATLGYTDVTISYNIRWNGPSGTRRIYCYFADDGTNFVSLGYTASFQGRDSYTVNSGSYTFTDDAKFRIQMYDTGGPVVYADDVLITGSPAYVAPGLVLVIK